MNKILLRVLLISGVLISCAFDVNAVENGDMENGVSNWSEVTNKKNVTVEESSEAHQGTKSLKVTNSSDNSYGVYQLIQGIEADQTYEINGWIHLAEGNASAGFIRVAWYASDDGSGSQLSTDDSEKINTTGKWERLSKVIKSDEKAKSAKIRLLVASSSEGNTAVALFDDVSLERVVFPSPTIVPTPTPKPPTSTPTIKVMATATKSSPTSGVLIITKTEVDNRTDDTEVKNWVNLDEAVKTDEAANEDVGGNEMILGEVLGENMIPSDVTNEQRKEASQSSSKENSVVFEKSQNIWIWAGIASVGIIISAVSGWLIYQKIKELPQT